jgi:uncharacterized NAD-dependent epimerase/dehydratase family protein
MHETAVILANGLLQTPFAKTTHGLVRGPSRYAILGVVDPASAGHDAGELLDGKPREIPVFESLASMIDFSESPPEVCIVGVATVGGVLPAEIRAELLQAAALGMTLVNGLHQLLSEDPELATLAQQSGARIIDIRKPKRTADLRFWTGEVLAIDIPRIAVLGTDCAVGKRTTAALLWQSLRQRGWRAEMIFTGQTGWLQGMPHGFVFDATPNDFVCGELEGAILACARERNPQIMLLEGQSGLRNPAGPCGAELILAGATRGVILQHAPGRRFYEDLEALHCVIPPVQEEIEMMRLMGADVWALTLNDENLDRDQGTRIQRQLAVDLGIPVVFPLWEGVETVVDAIELRLGEASGGAP